MPSRICRSWRNSVHRIIRYNRHKIIVAKHWKRDFQAEYRLSGYTVFQKNLSIKGNLNPVQLSKPHITNLEALFIFLSNNFGMTIVLTLIYRPPAQYIYEQIRYVSNSREAIVFGRAGRYEYFPFDTIPSIFHFCIGGIEYRYRVLYLQCRLLRVSYLFFMKNYAYYKDNKISRVWIALISDIFTVLVN